MIVSGTLVNIEDRTGNFNNDAGENVAYDFVLLTVREDSGKLVPVKVRREDQGIVQGLKLYGPVSLAVEPPGNVKLRLNAAETRTLAPVKSA